MADKEHLSILKQGIEVWNQWRIDNLEAMPDFRGAHLILANLNYADLSYVDLSHANLINANLINANLINANLTEADLSYADLRNADLHHANLTEADLSYANLRTADLYHAILSSVDLRNANLSHAHLYHADLYNANLTEADLRNANLSHANLRNANLTEANLTEANLSHTDLSHAYYITAELTGARIGWTVFVNVDLSEVKGLETIKHEGPSYIDIYTVYRSQGKIPEVFLRGAGVPDVFITYMQSLTSEAIKFYSCFISYSSKDKDLANRLYNDLQAQGVRCWFAPEDLKIGEETRQGIDDAIRVHDKLLLILSKHSVESNWVQKEVETAFREETLRKKQRQKKSMVLFPIRIDTAVMKSDYAWAKDICQMRNIGDFTQWKDHDAYQKAFERLLRDLKAEVQK